MDSLIIKSIETAPAIGIAVVVIWMMLKTYGEKTLAEFEAIRKRLDSGDARFKEQDKHCEDVQNHCRAKFQTLNSQQNQLKIDMVRQDGEIRVQLAEIANGIRRLEDRIPPPMTETQRIDLHQLEALRTRK